MASLGPALVAALRAGYRKRLPIAGRAALSMALPLFIGVLGGHPALGAAAASGALAGLYVPDAPYRYRGRVVAVVGLGLVVAVFLGGLASTRGWLTVLVVGVVAGVASFGCQAAQIPPPRELMPILGVLMASGVPVTPGEASERALLAAGGAMLAWLVSMSPALGRTRGPEERTVQAAFAAVANFLDAVGTANAAVFRHRAVLAVRQARAAIGQGGLPVDALLARAVVAAETLLETALHVEFEADEPLDPSWAVAVRALIPAGDSAGPVCSGPGGGPDPGAAPVGSGPLADGVRSARRTLAEGADVGVAGLPPWPGFGAQLRSAARRHSVVLPSAARLAIAVALGVGIGRAFGLSHAYWVGLSAVTALQGTNLVLVRRRVAHRMAGTVVGIGLAAAVLGWGPPTWVAALVIVLAQGFVEMLAPFHYGVAVSGITVLSLSLFHLSAPEQGIGSALGARLIDTAIGVALALLLRQLLWPRATSARLPFVQARTLASAQQVFGAFWAASTRSGGSPELTAARWRLQGDLTSLRALHDDALADVGAAGDARWPVTAAIEELAFLALSLPAHRPAPAPPLVDAFLSHLQQLGDAIADGAAAPHDLTFALPDHPRTTAAAAALLGAVRDAVISGR